MKLFNLSIKKSAFLILVITAAFSIFSISALWIFTEIRRSKETLDRNKELYENDQKGYLKNEVARAVEIINYTRSLDSEKSEEEIKDEILGFITKIRLKYGGYIFINTYEGKALVFDGVRIIGEKDISNMVDPDGLRLFDIEMECAESPDGGFFKYKFKHLDSFTPVPKLSYAYGYNDWNWIIGAGIYLDDVEQFLQEQETQHMDILYRKILYIALLFVVLLLLIVGITNYISVFLNGEIKVFTSFFGNNQFNDSIIDQKDLHIKELKILAHSVNMMISHRRLAEKLLKKERDKAQGYLKVAGVIILALDKEGFVTLINKKGCELLEYREEEIIGKNWFHHFIPLGQKQNIYDQFRAIMKDGNNTFLNKENMVITRSGLERNIQWHNSLIYDDDELVGSLSSGLDITEKKQVEASYFESEEKYRLLFKKSSDPVLIIGEEGTFIDCNRAAIKVLGYKSKMELIGNHPASISPELQPDGLSSLEKANSIIEIARKAGFHRFDWVHIDKNNEPFDIDVSLTDIPISGTRYLYVVWRNITEKKIQEQELIIAKEKAEKSDILKTSFLHNMQHEIRTPLNAIMGFTQLLQMQSFSKSVRDDYYGDILRSGIQLTKIIDKIIDFARLQSGDIYISRDKIELKTLLAEVFLKYHKQIQDRDIELIIEPNNNNYSPLVISDAHKVSDIIGHLVDNALKFTQHGKVEISYRIYESEIIFSVSDTGIGIEKDNFESIFGKFNRLTVQKNNKIYGGNGLGLSISKAVLEHMGGSISVDSEIGQGSIFSFSIPYNPADTSPHLNENHFADKVIVVVTQSKSKFQKITELVVSLKSKTVHLNAGIEAIEYFQNNYSADILLIDTELTGMNGLTTAKAILKFKESLPIISLVGHRNSKISKEETLLAGSVNYILDTETDEEILLAISLHLA